MPGGSAAPVVDPLAPSAAAAASIPGERRRCCRPARLVWTPAWRASGCFGQAWSEAFRPSLKPWVYKAASMQTGAYVINLIVHLDLRKNQGNEAVAAEVEGPV